MTNINNVGKAFDGAPAKDTELVAVFNYLLKQPATATQVAVALNIYRPNLCRRKRTLEKADKLRQVKRIICPITRHPAWQLTCNPDLFPLPSQPTLWEGLQ